MDKQSLLLNKAQSRLRWVILFLNCIMMIGNYYCYDIPAALKTQLDDYMGNPDDYETYFNLLYTVYSIPNIFLPFLGGFFVDKFGVRTCLVAFVTLITIGASIVAFGVSIESWAVMFLGRVVFGFGGESIAVANSSILADWFEGKEVAFAFGLNLSVARLGSVFNNLLSPRLADSSGVPFAFWFGAILCGVSLGCALLVVPIDAATSAQIEKNREEEQGALQFNGQDSKHNLIDGQNNSKELGEDEDDEEEVKMSEALSFPLPFWILVVSCVVVYGCVLPFNNIASSLLLERDFFMEPPSSCTLENPNECQLNGNNPVNCPSSKWYQPPLPYDLYINDVYYAELQDSDIDCGDDEWSEDGACTYEYCKRQDDGIEQASFIMSIPYVISACLSPVLGGFVDRFGQRAVIATLAPLSLVVVHLLMAISDVSPIGPMVGQGIAYSAFAAVIWPSVPLVVEKRLTGLGYGVITAVQNAGLAGFPLVVATIYSIDDEYIPKVEFFFVSLACLGVVVGLYLNYYDYHHNHVFNKPTAKIGEEEAEYETLLGEGEGLDHRRSGKSSFSAHEIEDKTRHMSRDH
mmetsp:Transcript_1682/g.2961  ORF Transcript_1682/g.2961 Transcript_1682/m.2961 type:complete len:576 (+) Transcript_1682:21-1748(+)